MRLIPSLLWSTMALIVLVSILLHGAKVTPIMRYLDRRRESGSPGASAHPCRLRPGAELGSRAEESAIVKISDTASLPMMSIILTLFAFDSHFRKARYCCPGRGNSSGMPRPIRLHCSYTHLAMPRSAAAVPLLFA